MAHAMTQDYSIVLYARQLYKNAICTLYKALQFPVRLFDIIFMYDDWHVQNMVFY